MHYVILSFGWAFGVLSFAHFLVIDPAAADKYDGETTAQSLNVREGPSVAHEIVTQIPNGTPVSIFEVENGWARIAAEGGHGVVSGWVSGKFVDVYEMALPQVASVDVSEELESDLPAVSPPQPIEVTTEAAEKAATEDVAEVTTETAAIASGAEDTTAAINDATAPAQQGADVVARLEVSDSSKVVSEEKSVVVQPDVSKPVLSEDAAALASRVADAPVTPQRVLAEPVPSETADTSNPLTYEALNISCRKGYFSDELETCTADVKIDLRVPENLEALIGDTLNVKCDVGFTYDSQGKTLSESKSDFVTIEMEQGEGSAILQSRIDFMFRVDGVTRVEIGDVACSAASNS